jgi:nitric oxide dioxygenase
VTVQVPMPDGVRQPRQYSLTRADDGEHRQFSVKRVHGDGKPDGEVSNLLHDTVDVGDRLTMSLPFGDVVLDDSGRPVVFASAGIGITPMAGMLSHLVAAGSHLPITLLHADLTRRPSRCAAGARRRPEAARRLGARLVRARRAQRRCRSTASRRDDGPRRRRAARRRRLLPVRAAAVHAGGPQRPARPGRAPRDIQYEVFGPDLWQADLVTEEPDSAFRDAPAGLTGHGHACPQALRERTRPA